MGPPAAGKSQFYKDYMRRERNKRYYCHVSRDLLGSWQKCVTECREGLVAGYSAVIDNTSPDIESRSRYIQLGSQCRVPVRCFWFMTSLEHALHNNQYRNHCIKVHVLIIIIIVVVHLLFDVHKNVRSRFQEKLRIT